MRPRIEAFGREIGSSTQQGTVYVT